MFGRYMQPSMKNYYHCDDHILIYICISAMNDFPVIGDPCFARRILGSLGGKHCESLQRNVWRGVVCPIKAVSLDRECRVLP